MKKDLTRGSITRTLLIFAGPMIAGNLLQQFYNIADTWIVGKFIGADAMAAVGTAYTLMSFLTSVLIGLCMGSGSVFSFYYGKKDQEKMVSSMKTGFLMIGGIALVVQVAAHCFLDQILLLLQVPEELMGMMQVYVEIIFAGIFFIFLYNYFAFLLRSVGNSMVPLYFLGGASILNILLDFLFVPGLHMGIKGAAMATWISQAVAGTGLGIYTLIKNPWLRKKGRGHVSVKKCLGELARFSFAASLQQSVMNFGILVIQGLVNSFGVGVMAAFTAAVKIDSLAYMPAQEFGNAFSLYVSQNHGAGQKERVSLGVKKAMKMSVIFCMAVSLLIVLEAPGLMRVFVSRTEQEIIKIGTGYLRIEGAFYCGIGVLFLLYAYYRGINKPEMSLVLTVISLGTRIILAYALSPIPEIGVTGIWWAIPIGWFLADLVGILFMKKLSSRGENKISVDK